MIRKNINNVTHKFLLNAKLDSNFPFSGLSIVLNQSVKLFLVKATGCWQRLSLHSLSHQSAFSQCAILTFFGSLQRSYHNKQPAFSSEFKWRDSFGSEKCNHIKLLKEHQRVLSAGFRFHEQ
jgi:hypothetical protein